MDTFEYHNKKGISINGKDYFLLRRYKKDLNRFILIQVSGNTPLNKEDMPSKEWEILKSKANSEKVYTAYIKSYFNYETKRKNQTLAFLGASTTGSYFIALKYIARRFNLNFQDQEIYNIALKYAKREIENRHLERKYDLGSSETDLIIVEFSYFFDKETASDILKGGE